jgi:hypothetical protein
MVFQISADKPQDAKALFTADGFEELTPDPAFDYRSYELDHEEAKSKLALLIDGMTKVEDKTARFVYRCRWGGDRQGSVLTVLSVPDGRLIDTCTYHRWEWPQAIGWSLLDVVVRSSLTSTGMNGLFDVIISIGIQCDFADQ